MNMLYRKGIFIILSLFLLFWGVYFYFLYLDYNENDNNLETKNYEAGFLNSKYGDNRALYEKDDQTEVDNIYLSLIQESSNVNFNEIISSGLKDYEIECHFSDLKGEFLKNTFTGKNANATIELIGKQKNIYTQKSFKIRLFDKFGLWNDQSIINLNKFESDPLRIRSKLSYDYLEIIPNIISRRTRFVKLFIKDDLYENSNNFKDYGLFTFVEQPTKLFLKNHNLDFNGHLYEVEQFNFYSNMDILLGIINNKYSLKYYDDLIEVKGDKNNKKLIEMIKDVNDICLSTEDVIVNNFDEENLLTWMAINIMFDNYKKTDEDYYLYSPLNSEKWFFIPGDFEKTWHLDVNRAQWQKGASMLWDNVLYRRIITDKEYLNKLSNKIEEILLIVTESKTNALLKSYEDIVFDNITKKPDLRYLPITVDEFSKQYYKLAEIPKLNSLYYYQTLEIPMPFALNKVKKKANDFIFSWEEAVDLQDDNVTYNFFLSKDLAFENTIINIKNIVKTEYAITSLEDGKYYWKVEAIDSEGNIQIASDIYKNIRGDKYYGQSDVYIYNQNVVD